MKLEIYFSNGDYSKVNNVSDICRYEQGIDDDTVLVLYKDNTNKLCAADDVSTFIADNKKIIDNGKFVF